MLFKRKNKNRYFRNFGIIDRLKILIRRKLMSTRKFLIVVDTTYSPVRTQFPSAIIDVQIITATDEQHARQLFLRSIPQNLANQLQHNLYVLDLESIIHEMDVVEQKGGTPAFKFVLPGNRRPPRSLGIEHKVITNLGNQTVTQENDSQTVDRRNPVPAPQPEAPTGQEVIAHANKSVRSAEFQKKEYETRLTSDVLNEKQVDIINKMGARQRMEGSDEAVNGQVNTTTGMNRNLRPQVQESSINESVSPQQAELLKKLGADYGTEIVHDPELQQELNEVNPSLVSDPSLAELPLTEVPLSYDDIQALASEENVGEDK